MDFDVVYSSVLKEYPDVLTPDETARALGVSTKTVYRLLRSNAISHIKMGRTYKVPKAHLLLYLRLYNPGVQMA